MRYALSAPTGPITPALIITATLC
ncbi:MAG: hypothetical protein QOH45_3886, partial [Pseudonocardiales bacterium]|nr:hypothetical protein [Pseudonocardiales bacterium]